MLPATTTFYTITPASPAIISERRSAIAKAKSFFLSAAGPMQTNKGIFSKAVCNTLAGVRGQWLRLSCLLWLLSVSALSAQEADSLPPLQRAQQLMQTYEYQQAALLLQALIKEDSLARQPLWLLAQAYAQLGQSAAAKQELLQLTALEPTHKPALGLLGQLSLGETNYLAAAEYYSRLLELDSTNAYFFRQRAIAAEKTGDRFIAINCYEKAIALAPQDVESLTELAELRLKQEESERAAALVQKGLQQDSLNLRLWRLQAKISYKLEDYKKAVEAVAYPLAAGDTAQYYTQVLGISHFHLANYTEAILWLSHLESHGLDTEVLYYYLGMSYRNAGESSTGIAYLEKAAKKGVSDNLSHYYTQLAVIHEEKEDHQKAIKAYKLAYKTSGERLLLYHLARNYDSYYKDKRVALNYYQKFLNEADTTNKAYQDYARYRASELKEHMHFNIDSL